MPDQGQMLDLQEGQTAESALRNDWPLIVPHYTLKVILEVVRLMVQSQSLSWRQKGFPPRSVFRSTK